MRARKTPRSGLRLTLLAASMLAAPAAWVPAAWAATSVGQLLPDGQTITPTAVVGSVYTTLNPKLADHPAYRAGQAMNTALSPDGKTLLVVTSGYNLLDYSAGTQIGTPEPQASTEYVFVYGLPAQNGAPTVLKQVLQVPNSFAGMVWSPDGSKFYVAGGVSDDVMVFAQSGGAWAQSSSIPLNHASYGLYFQGMPDSFLAPFLSNGLGFEESSSAAGLAISPDGSTLVVANIYNDSISVINTATGTVNWEYDLRPFNNNPAQSGVAGGESPFAVALAGNASTGYTAYVTSVRDREVDVVPVGAAAPAQGTISRIALPGNPNQLKLSADQTKLYVAQDNSDSVAVIDTGSNSVLEEINTIAPAGLLAQTEAYTGAAANGLALSPDGNTLYVTNGGANSVAVIPIAGPAPHAVAGLLPTGWYPHAVSVSADGKTLYVVNGKSDPGRNPKYETAAANQYVLQLEQAGFQVIPVPTGAALAAATAQVAANDGYSLAPNKHDEAVMAVLHNRIKHVIYIIKENRTYDQILGDLTNGANGKKSLAMFGHKITPNLHALASNFVTLDNFYCAGEVSGDGWAWSTEGRESDFGTKTIPMNYAGRGSSNDSEGSNRLVDVGLPINYRIYAFPFLGPNNLYQVLTAAFPGGYANLLPGSNNDFATDGPVGTPAQEGYIWDSAMRAGLTVRNYGFLDDIVRYNIPVVIGGIPLDENPAALGEEVAWSANPTLAPITDPYYRGFDNSFPDAWRLEEWNREFQQYVTNNNLPSLSLVRLMHDHTGNFSSAVAGINTPELQEADNDLAVGKLVDTVAHSPYASNTLIFVIEDDSQDGPDHVDSHRSTAYVVGPYVRQGGVVSTRYSTVNMVRTIEDVLGIDHLNLNDAYQAPMTDLFDLSQKTWSYTAVASPLLVGTGLGPLLPPGTPKTALKSTHDAAWWTAHTQGFDWRGEDRIPAARYNQILWEGLMPGQAYPQ